MIGNAETDERRPDNIIKQVFFTRLNSTTKARNFFLQFKKENMTAKSDNVIEK